MIRILGGEKKGTPLKVGRTGAVRPTAANVRRVLFDILGPAVAGTRWLDLYAGSGAVALEALSRGAEQCLMIESARRNLVAAKENIARLGYGGRCRLLGLRVRRALPKLVAEGERFDVIFLDPPYKGDEAERCLEFLGAPPLRPLLRSPEGWVIAQLSSHFDLKTRYGALVLERERKIGDTRLCFFRLEGEEGGESPGVVEEE